MKIVVNKMRCTGKGLGFMPIKPTIIKARNAEWHLREQGVGIPGGNDMSYINSLVHGGGN